MRDYENAVAVITGAGSGIGRALALALAARGAHLAISDINQAGLDETVKLLGPHNVEVRADYLDVTDEQAVLAYAEAIQTHFDQVNMVFNNAGAAINGEFRRLTPDDMRWQMDVNFWGVAYGSQAFLPVLEEADWGHIVNVSSLFGLIASPRNSAYNASKFAVRGMTEALRIELDMAGSSVSATSVHPGGIKTNIVHSARLVKSNDPGEKTRDELAAGFDKVARTSPEQAAEIILKAVEKNKKRVLVGFDAWMVDKIQRLFPTHYHWIMVKLFGYGLD